MSESKTPSPGSGLSHLEGQSFQQILTWLERALLGIEVLPTVVPGELPEGPILRWESALKNITRQDLRKACQTLVRRFAQVPKYDTAFVQSLLSLAVGLRIEGIIPDLHYLATTQTLEQLPEDQTKAVISALLELKAPLPRDHWLRLADRLPDRQKTLAVAALLRHGLQAAFEIIQRLPDEEEVADSLFVVLDQHSQLLSSAEAGKMAATARACLDQCAPEILKALQEWFETVPTEGVMASAGGDERYSRLDSALAAFCSKSERPYELRPTSARLVAA